MYSSQKVLIDWLHQMTRVWVPTLPLATLEARAIQIRMKATLSTATTSTFGMDLIQATRQEQRPWLELMSLTNCSRGQKTQFWKSFSLEVSLKATNSSVEASSSSLTSSTRNRSLNRKTVNKWFNSSKCNSFHRFTNKLIWSSKLCRQALNPIAWLRFPRAIVTNRNLNRCFQPQQVLTWEQQTQQHQRIHTGTDSRIIVGAAFRAPSHPHNKTLLSRLSQVLALV